MDLSELLKIETPKAFTNLTNPEFLTGKIYPAIDQLQIMHADDFEVMVAEWVVGYLIPKDNNSFIDVLRAPGSGDMGRDVMGILNNNEWVNFQCKHYDEKLSPSIIWLELGKLCYYTFTKKFTIPKEYYFVTPKGIGPQLANLIENPTNFNQLLIDNWDKKCKNEITNVGVLLDGDFLEYVKSFDFSIIKQVDPLILIEHHKQTSYHLARFGVQLNKRRKEVRVPDEFENKEIKYIEELFKAYSDEQKMPLTKLEDIKSNEDLINHFKEQRLYFYFADTLDQFGRDNIPPESDCFQELKDEIYSGVSLTFRKKYADGLERLNSVLEIAQLLPINSNPLTNYWKLQDKKGICHHLVNDGKLNTWIK